MGKRDQPDPIRDASDLPSLHIFHAEIPQREDVDLSGVLFFVTFLGGCINSPSAQPPVQAIAFTDSRRPQLDYTGVSTERR